MEICPKCNKEWDNQHEFCGSCGSKLEDKPTFCGQCGNMIDSGQKFCGVCGTPVQDPIEEKINGGTSQIYEKFSAGANQLHDKISGQMKQTFSEENIKRFSEQAKNASRKAIETSSSAEYVVGGIWEFLADIAVKLVSFLNKLFGEKISQNTTDDEKFDTFLSTNEKACRNAGYIVGTLFIIGAIVFVTKNETLGLIALLAICVVVIVELIFFLIITLRYIKDISRTTIAIFIRVATYLFISCLVLLLSCIIPFLPLILIGMTIYVNRRRRIFLSKYKRYTYLFIWIMLVNIAVVIPGTIFSVLSEGALKKAETASYRIESMAGFYSGKQIEKIENKISNLTAIGYSLSIISVAIYALFFFLYSRKIVSFYKKEREIGMKYDDIVKLMWLVPVTWLLLMISVFSLLDIDGLDPESILGGANLNTDPSYVMMGDGSFATESSVINTQHTAMSENETGGIFTSTEGNTDSLSLNQSPELSGTMNTIFNFSGHSLSIDPSPMIPIISSPTDTIVINDADNFTSAMLKDGTIYDGNSTVIGSYVHNQTLNRIDFFDSNHQPVYSVDGNGVYYDGNQQPAGHASKAGQVTTVFDKNEKVLYQIMNGSIFDQNGAPIGNIRKV